MAVRQSFIQSEAASGTWSQGVRDQTRPGAVRFEAKCPRMPKTQSWHLKSSPSGGNRGKLSFREADMLTEGCPVPWGCNKQGVRADRPEEELLEGEKQGTRWSRGQERKACAKEATAREAVSCFPPGQCVLTRHIGFGRSPDSKVSLGHSHRSGGGHSEPCHRGFPPPKTVASEQPFIKVKTSEVWEVPSIHPSGMGPTRDSANSSNSRVWSLSEAVEQGRCPASEGRDWQGLGRAPVCLLGALVSSTWQPWPGGVGPGGGPAGGGGRLAPAGIFLDTAPRSSTCSSCVPS